MKKLSIFCSLLIFSIYCFAQGGTIGIGLSSSIIGYSNIANHSVLKKRYNKQNSSSFGIDIFYNLNDKFMLSTGILTDNRGGEFTSFEQEVIFEDSTLTMFTLGDTVNRDLKNKFSYLTFPLEVRYKLLIHKKFSIDLGFGVYFSRLLKQEWEAEVLDIPTFNIESDIRQVLYKKNDFGIISGLGLKYDFSSMFWLRLSVNYLRGLTSMFRETDILGEKEEVKAYHQRIFTGITVGFGMSKIKKR